LVKMAVIICFFSFNFEIVICVGIEVVIVQRLVVIIRQVVIQVVASNEVLKIVAFVLVYVIGRPIISIVRFAFFHCD